MAVANALAYNTSVLITAVKSFGVQAQRPIFKLKLKALFCFK
jgi:hypothetical protein